MKIIDHIRNYC